MGNTEIFDTIANRYDTPERIHLAKVSSEAIREYLVDTQSKHAIDFGCGTGLVGMDLLKDFKSILFIDSAENMILEVKQKIACANLQNAETLCFNLEKDKLSDIQADYIFMAQVLLHIKDFSTVLFKLYDLLKPGGHLIIVDFNKHEKIVSDLVHDGFNQKELIEIMTEIRFREIQAKTFYTGSKIFMGQDASLFVLDAQKEIFRDEEVTV